MFSKSTPDVSPTTPPSSGPTPQPPPSPAMGLTPTPPRPPAPPAPSTPSGSVTASVLGPDLKIRGGIEGRGEIQLQGRAWGDVKVERLVVGEAAELEGSVVAHVVEIRGRVAGSVEANIVRLLPTSRVEGDITYEQLQIDAGAQFEGRCIRGLKAEAAPVAPPALAVKREEPAKALVREEPKEPAEPAKA